MIAPKFIEQLADEFNLTTRQIEAYWYAFSSVSRVCNIKTYNELSQTIVEKRVGDEFYYSELPTRLVEVVRRAIEEAKDLGKSYGDVDSVDNLRKFIRGLRDKRREPRDYCIDGILTYRNAQRGEKENHLFTLEVQEISYQEREEALL